MDHDARLELARNFSKEARALFGNRIRDILLYGSVSRNEDTETSDIDVLVVLEEGQKDIQRELSFLSFDIGLGSDEHISVQTVTSSHMREFKDFSFFRNIERDGMILG